MQQQSSEKALPTGVIYQKGIVEEKWLIEPYGFEAPHHRHFFSFWAHSFCQLRLSLVPNDGVDAPTPKTAVNYLNDIKKYGSHQEGPYERKYEGPYHVVFDGIPPNQPHRYVAVLDHDNPNRAFIGETDGRNMCGGVCYFDKDGKMDGLIEPFDRKLFEHDYRNGDPGWNNLYFCGNTLAFKWSYRRVSSNYKLEGWRLGKALGKDRLTGKFDGLTSWYGDTPHLSEKKSEVVNQRWLCILSMPSRDYDTSEGDEYAYHCVDLKSIRQGNGREVIYDSITIPQTMDPEVVLDSIEEAIPSYEPMPTWIEGYSEYPARCIVCGQETVRAYVNGADCGLGACRQCMIRYSSSGGNWKCMKIRAGNHGLLSECDGDIVDPAPGDCKCMREQEHADEHQLSVTVEESVPKEEGKQTRIQITAKRKRIGSS